LQCCRRWSPSRHQGDDVGAIWLQDLDAFANSPANRDAQHQLGYVFDALDPCDIEQDRRATTATADINLLPKIRIISHRPWPAEAHSRVVVEVLDERHETAGWRRPFRSPLTLAAIAYHVGCVAARRGWVFDRSKANDLADEDDVDAARELLVDLEDLADEAVLAVRGDGSGVLEFQAVLVDSLPCRL
jgi:hypothetical protein